MESKFQGFQKVVNNLYAFTKDTKNAHRHVKLWAPIMKGTVEELAGKMELFRRDCDNNEKEIKRLRRLVINKPRCPFKFWRIPLRKPRLTVAHPSVGSLLSMQGKGLGHQRPTRPPT